LFKNEIDFAISGYMGNINDLSDKEWKELVNELSVLQYQERIKILYDRFNIIWGSEVRAIGKKEAEAEETFSQRIRRNLPMSKSERESVQNLSTDTKAVIRKTFLPEIDGDAPFNQVIDLWMTLEMKGKDIDVVYQDALARQELIEYINNRLLELEGVLPEGTRNDFVEYTKIEGKDPLDVYIGLTVRNTMLAHVEMQLNQFQVLAGEKEETVEETKERLFKNSAK
jgi:hypothetical protein